MSELLLKEMSYSLNGLAHSEAWGALSCDELATEVQRFAAPLLDDTEQRDGLYELLNARPLERLTDREIVVDSRVLWAVKNETAHPGGAYKLRGAYWNLTTQYLDNPNISEVHCTSTGNHGLGVVEACNWLNKQHGTNITAVVHVPKNISSVKLHALQEGGAAIQEAETFEAAHQETEDLKELSTEPGSSIAVIEPYDDPRTIAGQASCGLEIAADFVGDLFTQEGVDLNNDEITVWVPGGGGGFAAGCAVALDYYRQLGMIGPNVHLKVAQMENCDALARAQRSDEPLTEQTLDTSSDATALLNGGSLTQKVLADERFVTDIVSVPKHYVGLAMEILERHHGHPVEPAGAVALAGSLWSEDENPRGQSDLRRVHVTVTSGANVSLETQTHFAEAVTPWFRFQRQSNAYRGREVYGVDEVLARLQGGAALRRTYVANGPTS